MKEKSMEIELIVRTSPEQLLEENRATVYRNCLSSISLALEKKLDTADVVTIISNYDGDMFSLTLNQSEWISVLEDCIVYFKNIDEVNLAIEAYQLLSLLSK